MANVKKLDEELAAQVFAIQTQKDERLWIINREQETLLQAAHRAHQGHPAASEVVQPSLTRAEGQTKGLG
eukprot:8876466-Pyramimonas_sp.AAC.1